MSKDKNEKQKDIDDVLSSIDSLLDTATDVNLDELPELETKPEQEPDPSQDQEKIKKVTASKKSPPGKNRKLKSSVTRRSKFSKTQDAEKKEPTITNTDKTAKKQRLVIKKPKEQNVSDQIKEPETTDTHPVDSEVKDVLQKKTQTPTAETGKTGNAEQTESIKTISGTKPTNFSSTQRELPVLDEIITEEEMVLIAAGKELPKRVITEKFVPKSITDKIIEVMAIQLADYNITRLEYEYLHELIDEILAEENNKITKK